MAAILDFWRAILNQFLPNFVHAYKIHFWISFVLCVVLKCQYFWSYSRKKHFSPFIYIFKRTITHSKIARLTRFFLQVKDILIKFFVHVSYRFLKIMRRKCQKTEFRCGHLGFLAVILDIPSYFLTLLVTIIICNLFGAFITIDMFFCSNWLEPTFSFFKFLLKQ